MTRPYPVPSDVSQVEEVVRRSRFVTRVGRAQDRAAASRFVQEARERLPGATHYCWAFNVGPPGSSAHAGKSDAGEPPGTAGQPMLVVLLNSGVGQVATVCARYYGGVKLGRGGLARAYASGVKRALAVCPTARNAERTAVVVAVAYSSVESVERILREMDAVVVEREFGATARYRVLLPVDRRRRLAEAVAAATGGSGVVSPA